MVNSLYLLMGFIHLATYPTPLTSFSFKSLIVFYNCDYIKDHDSSHMYLLYSNKTINLKIIRARITKGLVHC